MHALRAPPNTMTGLNLVTGPRILDSVMFANPLAGHLYTPGRLALRPGSLVRRFCACAAGVVATSLVLFHASLFYTHAIDGRLADPAVALRWSLGAVLAALLVAFGTMGLPLFRGRRALIVWLLVSLLHVSTARTATLEALTSITPEETAVALIVLPSAAAPLVWATAMLLAGVLLKARTTKPLARASWLAHDADARISSRQVVPLLVPRAPPRCCLA